MRTTQAWGSEGTDLVGHVAGVGSGGGDESG